MMRPLRAVAATVAAVLSMAVLPVSGPAASATAAAGTVNCVPPSSNVTTFEPPLTNTPQPVRIVGSTQFGPCVSASDPEVTSGTSYVEIDSVTRSCGSLLAPTIADYTIVWNTGETSTISGNRTSTIEGVVVVVTLTGTVTSGPFAGSSVVQTISGPSLDLLNCTLGLGSVSAVYSLVTLTIA